MNNRNNMTLDEKLRLLLKEIGLEEVEDNHQNQNTKNHTRVVNINNQQIKDATAQVVNKAIDGASKTVTKAVDSASKSVNDAVSESVRQMFAQPKSKNEVAKANEQQVDEYERVKQSFAKPNGDDVFLDSQMKPNTIDSTFQNAREYTGTFLNKLKNFATALLLLIVVSAGMYLFEAPDFALVPISILLLGNLFLTWPMNLKLVLPISLYMFGFFAITDLNLLQAPFNNIYIIAGMVALIGYYWAIIKSGQVKKARVIKYGSLSASNFKGMDISDQDAKFVADELNKVEISINKWEDNIKQSPKLRKIEEDTKGLQAAKALFALLVKMPKQVNNAGEFVYRHIPNVENLSNTYIEVANHSFKNDETVQTLYDSEELMRKLSKQIVQDYSNLVSSDLYKLEVEMNMAKKNLNK